MFKTFSNTEFKKCQKYLKKYSSFNAFIFLWCCIIPLASMISIHMHAYR